MSYTFNKKLVEQLRKGEICAEFNREKDSLEMLQALLDTAFPDDDTKATGEFEYYWVVQQDDSVWVSDIDNTYNKTPIPLSNFVQPEQSERDVMAELDERLKRLEDILLRDNEPCKAEPEPADAEIVKPPLGIDPEWLWREQRLMTLMSAIERYSNAGIEIPNEWLNEVSEHTFYLENRNKPDPAQLVGERTGFQAEEMAVLMQFTLNNPDKVKKLMNDEK